MLSNLPPGITTLPGDHDRDVSYTATITIYHTINGNITNNTEMINDAIKKVNQRYIGVTPDYSTIIIDEIEPNEYINFHFNAYVEGDTCIDMSYVGPEDDADVYEGIIEDIIDKLNNYGISEVEIDNADIEYEVV